MKNIVRLICIVIVTITAASAGVRLNLGVPVEYKTESKEGVEYVHRISGDDLKVYILNEPEVLKKELSRQGYTVFTKKGGVLLGAGLLTMFVSSLVLFMIMIHGLCKRPSK